MRRQRRTKIVATLGPASSERAVIARLFEAGADVFRINMSHTSHDKLRELVTTIRGIGDCLAHGYDRTGFFEVDTGEQRAWTVQLTESAEQPAAQKAAPPGNPLTAPGAPPGTKSP